MAVRLLKPPLISRCWSGCAGDWRSVGRLKLHAHPTPVGLSKSQVQSSFRAFAVAKENKAQVPRKKRRLDEICLERYEKYSRSFIQSWILQGKVFVNGKRVNKAGTQVSESATVEIIAEVPKYVCRGGYKLEAALEKLEIHVEGRTALDSGLSTGGFTDCLLQHGASHVYGVDVGYGQVADKIRQDERVSVIERTNLRYISSLPEKVDLVTLDLSFISILLDFPLAVFPFEGHVDGIELKFTLPRCVSAHVMPAVVNVMKEESTLITLVKPQFEALRSQVGGGGVVRDPKVHQEVLEKIIKGVEEFGFHSKGWIESPLKGAEGNTEFLVRFDRTSRSRQETDSIV